MRKPLTRPRLAEGNTKAAALLERIHALGQTFDVDVGSGARDTIAFLAEHLKTGEVCLARHVHDLLQAEIAKCLEGCGYVERDEAELLRALKDFAQLSEWAYENGGWTTRADRVRALAEAARA
jgi:hypothetical protein